MSKNWLIYLPLSSIILSKTLNPIFCPINVITPQLFVDPYEKKDSPLHKCFQDFSVL